MTSCLDLKIKKYGFSKEWYVEQWFEFEIPQISPHPLHFLKYQGYMFKENLSLVPLYLHFFKFQL